MVLPQRLNSRGSSSTSIHFPSRVISFGCIETLGPMLDSKNGLKDDPINYACKMFAEMPNKKIDMKVEHPVINDSENLASYMFDEMFQPVSVVKGEYNDLVMFNMQLGLGIARCSEEMFGMLSTCTYVQLINRGITDHFSRLGRASLIVTLQLFTPNHCGEEKLQGLLEALAARYSEQFPNIQVNKDDVLLFAIFGVVHISKSTLLYLVFDSGAKFFMVPIPVTTSYIYVWDCEKSFETMALSNYPVKAEALQLQGCSTGPDEAYYCHCKFDGIDTKILFIPRQNVYSQLDP
ncbi:hypothetical protein KY285_016779 [Solanum tuberosum]|nr:hypothetical protein KY285_016779 [Solanum tuberosum]